MKAQRIVLLVGLALPFISLLFVENYAPQMGFVWNAINSDVVIAERGSYLSCIEQKLVSAQSKPADQRDSVSINSRVHAECEEKTKPLSIKYKWVLLLSLGLIVFSFPFRQQR